MTTPNHSELITQIGVIETNHCQYCEKWANQAQSDEACDVCAGCPYYAKIRSLGRHLDDPTERKHPRSVEMTVTEYIDYIDRGYDTLGIALEKGVDASTINGWKRRNGLIAGRPKFTMTIAQYRQLRGEGMSKQAIAKHLNVASSTLRYWARRNGLDAPIAAK